jgi:hypothetical protein
MEKKTMFTCDYNEFERLVVETFKVDQDYYEFVADMECGNDSGHEFNVKKEPLGKYEQEDLDKWLAGSGQGWMTHNLIQEMCNRGVIEEGNYLISVCW